MLYRIIILFVFYLGIQNFLLADVGSQNCMKATIVMKNGMRHEGYFGLASYLYIEKEGGQFRCHRSDGSMILLSNNKVDSDKGLNILETDDHFHRYVRTLLSTDTLRLYSNVSMIPFSNANSDRESITAYLGSPVNLLSNDIANVVIQKVYFSNLETVNTKCNYDDMTWLKNRVVSRESIDIDVESLCIYRVIFFRNNKDKAHLMLMELSRAYRSLEQLYQKGGNSRKEYQKIQNDIDYFIEQLRKENILVTSSCSC
jgi:hypothetical protein